MNVLWVFIGFNLFVVAMLAVDLVVFHREGHAISVKEAAIWSVVWVALALAFAAGVGAELGHAAATAFLTGYLIEKALSVDNLFVFVVIFGYFQVPARFQHRVLFWGILGALVMRGTLIGAGAYFISRFHWLLYVLGAFLVVTGVRMFIQDDEPLDLGDNRVLRLVRRLLPVSDRYHGRRFFTREPSGAGRSRWIATPLFVVVVLVETTDVVFAVDSIPAVFSVTQDPLIVYTSNIFAILGLRALYFLLAHVVQQLHYLKAGLSVVLVFIGTKMLIAEFYAIPVTLSLGVVGLVLLLAVGASLVWPAPDPEREVASEGSSLEAPAGEAD